MDGLGLETLEDIRRTENVRATPTVGEYDRAYIKRVEVLGLALLRSYEHNFGWIGVKLLEDIWRTNNVGATAYTWRTGSRLR